MDLLHSGKPLSVAADKADMDEKTARKYRRKTDSPNWGGRRAGAGRPAVLEGGTEILSVRVPCGLMEEIRASAKLAGVETPEWVRTILSEGLKVARVD